MSDHEGPLRIIVVDDQAIIRSGLGAFLMAYNELQLVGEASDGEEAIQLCEIVRPDVVLMDLKMPNMDGITATRVIIQRWPETRVIILTNFRDSAILDTALEAGAVGYLLKDITAQELANAIFQISEGRQPETPQEGTAASEQSPETESSVPLVDRSEEIPFIQGSLATQELLRAGKMQADILPDKPPVISGWGLAARLVPARETSGDFYDFIPLDNGKWGFVIADVSDKGMGAALFMALVSTLIRTYATQYPTLPAFALSAVNRRILKDTRGNMFVTTFYGVLDPETGRFRYVNAGHNPPILLSTQRSKHVDQLGKTGMALGVLEEASWQQKVVKFAPGDCLLLYTDGVTEAQNSNGAFYGQKRLLEAMRARMDCSAEKLQELLMEDIFHFIEGAPNQDDITMLVLTRDS
ncbi:MAG: SpoIIE family protein phosphatase [Anaerolineales bacterium]|jgi:sigma-B regulation protein RsbU (phosphoserine phosphatase)